MSKPPKIYTIRNGTLTINDQNVDQCQEPKNEKIIRYHHNTKITPDQYHTQMIKQYRRENQELRKNYGILQKQYYNLLGYCWQENVSSKVHRGEAYTPIRSLYKDKMMENSVIGYENQNKTGYEQSGDGSLENKQQINFDEDKDEKTKIITLSQSILQEQFDEQAQNCSRKRNSKTEPNQNIQDMLLKSLNEVQQLRELLQLVKANCATQIQKIKLQCQQKIYNLQTILEAQRKQSIILSSTINRMKDQQKEREHFFRDIKEMDNCTEKQQLEKFIEQYQIVV